MVSKEDHMGYPFYTRDIGDIKSDIDTPAGVFDHPSGYLPDPGLVDAVNVALLLNMPLLLTGEPGTGKTQLAYSVAWQLAERKLMNINSGKVEKFETKSSSVATDLLYTFDTIRRFHAAQSGGSQNNVDYITYNALGKAILNAMSHEEVESVLTEYFKHNGPTRSVVLIDEIDKAPRDFPNDLLNEIEQMYFKIPELEKRDPIGGPKKLAADFRPIVIITSNSERNLPDPFLRRCIYYDIPFPTEDELNEILLSRLPLLGSKDNLLLRDSIEFFLKLRKDRTVRRKISSAELIKWLDFMLRRGAAATGTLKDSSAIAFEGLSSLTKDPADQLLVKEQLKAFLGNSS
jgi:MoxR-like ATPase